MMEQFGGFFNGGIMIKKLSNFILLLFFLSISWVYASYIIPNGSVTQMKLAARSTGTSVGVGGVAISTSSGNFATSSTSPVSVTNLSVTLTTTGRPVFITLISDGSSSSNLGSIGCYNGSTTGICKYFYRDGSSVIASHVVNTPQLLVNSGPFGFIYPISAGTYTFSVQTSVDAGTTQSQFLYLKLVAYEL